MRLNINPKNGIIVFAISEIPIEMFKANLEKFNSLMNKLTDEFIHLELFNAEELIKYGKENNIYLGDDYIFFKHSKGTAMLRVMNYGFKKENGYTTDIEPAIQVSTMNFIHGWSFSTGCFADVYLVDSFREYLSFSTRDTLYIHNLYLHWVLSKLEEQFANYNEEYNKPLHRDIIKLNEIKKDICLEFDEYITRNKSKRIDTLMVDGVSVKDYIKKNIKYKYVHSDLDVYKCCMIYGKPYKQVKDYVDSVLD